MLARVPGGCGRAGLGRRFEGRIRLLGSAAARWLGGSIASGSTAGAGSSSSSGGSIASGSTAGGSTLGGSLAGGSTVTTGIDLDALAVKAGQVGEAFEQLREPRARPWRPVALDRLFRLRLVAGFDSFDRSTASSGGAFGLFADEWHRIRRGFGLVSRNRPRRPRPPRQRPLPPVHLPPAALPLSAPARRLGGLSASRLDADEGIDIVDP